MEHVYGEGSASPSTDKGESERSDSPFAESCAIVEDRRRRCRWKVD